MELILKNISAVFSDIKNKIGVDPETKLCKKCEDNEGIDPVTKECITCAIGSTANPNNNYVCECSEGLGINITENICQKCNFGEGINPKTKKCGKCQSKYGIDPTTRICRMPIHDECIDALSSEIKLETEDQSGNYPGYICKCNNKTLGFNVTTDQCIDCKEIGQNINWYTSICMECSSDQILNETTNRCMCPPKKGFDNDYLHCYECQQAHGIDKYTLQCRPSSSDSTECINQYTGMWQNIPRDQYSHYVTKICYCYNGYVVNPITGACSKCEPDEGIDYQNGICKKCDIESGEGIDVYTRICRLCNEQNEIINMTSNECACSNKYGFQTSTHKCVNCVDYLGQKGGIDPITRECIECKSNEGTDPITGFCRRCNKDEGIDIFTGECQVCGDGATPDPNSYLCTCSDGKSYDPVSKTCSNCSVENGFAVDLFTGECRLCNGDYENIDAAGRCVCINKTGFHQTDHYCTNCSLSYDSQYGVNSKTYLCEKCENSRGFGIDPTTGFCTKCNENEGIDPISKQCTLCTGGSYLNPNTYKCTCRTGFGMNKNNECQKCEFGEGINIETNRCDKCNDYEGINITTSVCNICNSTDICIDHNSGECLNIPNGQKRNPETYSCECDNNKGFDPIDGTCIDCGDDKAVDWITANCSTCPEDQLIDTKLHRCICPDKKGFNENYSQCIDCEKGYGIDPETRKCTSDESGSYCIDRITGVWREKTFMLVSSHDGNRICTCISGYGFNQTTGECQQCGVGQGVDPVTNQCIECPQGYGVDLFNITCRECNGHNEILDEETKNCICSNGNGYDNNGKNCMNCSTIENGALDTNTHKCKKCLAIYGNCIDQTTGICRLFNTNEGIIPKTNICLQCMGGSFPDKDTHLCKCDYGFGYDPVNNSCSSCNNELGYGVDIFTGECRICSTDEDEILDNFTGKCLCTNQKGYDKTTHKCIKCAINEGIDQETTFCTTCDNGNHEAIDHSSRFCRQCNDDEGIDEETKECKKCSVGEILDLFDYQCKQCDEYKGIDPVTKTCQTCDDTTKCIDYLTKECTTIQSGQDKNWNYLCICQNNNFGFNESTGYCVDCGNDKAIDWIDGSCTSCPSGQIVDEKRHRCICEDKKAYSSDYKECVNCPTGYGIDNITLKCRTSNDLSNECIDQYNGMWRPVDEDSLYTANVTNLCTCYPGLNYDQQTNKCSRCPTGNGVDWFTGECRPCTSNEIMDIETQKCICKDKMGFNSNDHSCINCPIGQGIDEETKICGKCNSDEGIDKETRICTKCQNTQIIDSVSFECICPDKLGFNPYLHKCINCSKQYGIDLDTNKCIVCSGDNCIDKESRKCVPLGENVLKNPDTYECDCENGLGFNPSNYYCEKCHELQGIDPETKQCIKCHEGYGINQTTKLCEKCPLGQGVDSSKLICTVCKDGEGINPTTKICEKCQYKQGIDSLTRICGICNSGYGIDSSDNVCKKCLESNCVICSRNNSYCNFCNENFISKNGLCVYDDIPHVIPTPRPDLVNCTIKDNGDILTIEVPENSIASTNYVVNIEQNEKTIVIDDIGQSQLELIINENVKDITILQNTTKPLEIIINHSKDDNISTVIKIDSSKVSSTENISLKGEGQLKIESKNNEDELNINKIVPNVDTTISIDSELKVTVDRIVIYGNSKVEFTNLNKKAVVKSVTLQQKASTELNNIAIEGELKTGLLSMVSLSENANLAKTDIEISYSNGTQKDNPTLIGDLKSVPNSITFINETIGNVLQDNENEIFVIAESDNVDFDCNKWASKFVPSFDVVFDNVKCVNSENEMKRLVAYHNEKNIKKKNLGSGTIAGITIAVIVVVAVIVILVVFFVIRKKRNSWLNESLSGNEDDFDVGF